MTEAFDAVPALAHQPTSRSNLCARSCIASCYKPTRRK